MKKNDKLHFVVTGGTIDSKLDPVQETVIPLDESVIPMFIESLKLYEDCEFTTVCMKDSRGLTEKDVKDILKTIEESQARRLLVTHGSFTVEHTARLAKKQFVDTDKVIVFICSMIPLSGFASTDAGFNIGYAVAKTQSLKPGVYVCMNGRVFDPKEVTKILEEGRFGSIYNK